MSRTKNNILSYGDVLTSGKFKGSIINTEFVEKEFKYLYWLQEKEIKELSPLLLRDVEYLYQKEDENLMRDNYYGVDK